MYRILLVDDDPILLSGIKRLINWDENNCLIAGTASDGNEAMKKMTDLQPDIVVCDIAMPGISGLDLLKQAEAELPGTVFIMLTNQENFEFAREALHYRAAEYLIKSSLGRDILEKAVANAVTERENRKKIFMVNEDEKIFHARQRQEQIGSALNQFLYQNNPLQTDAHRLLHKEGMLSGFAFALIPLNFSILPDSPGISADERRKIFNWQYEITNHLATSFFSNYMLFPHSRQQITAPPLNESNAECFLLFAWKQEAKTWETGILRFRERLIKISNQITRLGVDVLPSVFFESSGTRESPRQVLRRIEEQYYRTGKGTHSETIQKAIQYILNNVEKRIMLQDVANFACISPGYLSTLFKREHNQNLIDFINQTKIDRACELLRENKLRINEISYILGYENAFYFSRVFRQYTGSTPSEFKEKIGGN